LIDPKKLGRPVGAGPAERKAFAMITLPAPAPAHNGPGEVGNLLSPFLPGEPPDLLATYSKRLLEWDDARQRAWKAKVSGTHAERMDADLAEMEAFDRLNFIKEHIAASFTLAVRLSWDLDFKNVGVPSSIATTIRDELASLRSYISDSIHRLRDDLSELADYAVSLESRRAVA
jgi:hypothetical protein